MSREDEIDFLRAYKDFIFYFNMLERNIGYCLSICLKRKGNGCSEKWLTASFDMKVKRLMILAKELELHEKFETWHLRVRRIRHLRNIVSHGQWEWKDWLSEPIYFHAPEIENGKGKFTIQEFRGKLSELLEISEVFSDIRTLLERASEKKTQQVAGGDATR